MGNFFKYCSRPKDNSMLHNLNSVSKTNKSKIIIKQYICDLYDLTFGESSQNLSFHFDYETFTLFVEYIGYKDTEFNDGQYFIKFCIPCEYPLSPPTISVLTKSGRFIPNQALSMSISSYHKESWVPMSFEFLIMATISAFTDNTVRGIGHLSPTLEEIKQCAQNSREYNKLYYPNLYEIFDHYSQEKRNLVNKTEKDRQEYISKLKNTILIN